MSCRSNVNPADLDGDGYDDVTGMPTHSTNYDHWKYDTQYDTPYDGYKAYDGYRPYSSTKSLDHYTPYDNYGFDDHDGFNDHYNDYGYGSYGRNRGGYGGYDHYGGYVHADDFAAKNHEKVQGKNLNMGAQKHSNIPEKQ